MKVEFYENAALDGNLVAELTSALYPKPMSLDYWNWRFLNNPLEETPHIAYILDNGKLACFYAVSEARFRTPNGVLKCGLLLAAMSHPDYQGQGLFAKVEVALHERLMVDKGFDFLYGFANHNAHRIHRKHGGWKDLFVLNNFYSTSDKITRKAAPFSDQASFIYKAAPYDFNKLNTLAYDSFETGFARSADVLSWRFGEDPRNDYQVFELHQADRLVGAIIFKEYQGSIDLMEIFFEPNRQIETLKAMLATLAANYKGFYLWSNLYSDEHVELESLGFEEREFNTYFGYISEKQEIDQKRLHFRFTDSDVY